MKVTVTLHPDAAARFDMLAKLAEPPYDATLDVESVHRQDPGQASATAADVSPARH